MAAALVRDGLRSSKVSAMKGFSKDFSAVNTRGAVEKRSTRGRVWNWKRVLS